MAQDTTESIDAALDNLATIKQGGDPRSTEQSDRTPSPEEIEQSLTKELDPAEYDDRLRLAKAEVGRLYAAHDLSEHLSVEKLHVAVARWDRRHGVAKYHTALPRDSDGRFDKQMRGLPSKRGHHLVAINETIESAKEFIDTVRHEVAHAIAYEKHGGSQKHNHNWKALARQLGADDSARHDRAHTNDDERYNYYIRCPSCGEEAGRVRLSKVIKQPFNRMCGSCGERHMSSYEAGAEPPEEHGVVRVSDLDYEDRDGWLSRKS